MLFGMGFVLVVLEALVSRHEELWYPFVLMFTSAIVLTRDWVGRHAG
jgi:hypothetical protein